VNSTFTQGLQDAAHASELCGYRVQSVRDVSVSNIQTNGNETAGIGFAAVSATPVFLPGTVPGPTPCTGNYAFQYTLRTQYQGRERVVETDLTDAKLYRPIQLGATVTGTLLDGDYRLSDGSLMDDYGILLTAGQTVTIVVRGGPSLSSPGQNLDMMFAIVANNTELAQDDDSAGNLNARIVFTPPASGLYFIRVSTAGAGMQMGSYTVQTMPGGMPTAI
jgi:hypothetical protein